MQGQAGHSDYHGSWQNLDMMISLAELQQRKMWCCFNDLVSLLELMRKPFCLQAICGQVGDLMIEDLVEVSLWVLWRFWVWGIPYIGFRASLSAAATSSARIASWPWALILWRLKAITWCKKVDAICASVKAHNGFASGCGITFTWLHVRAQSTREITGCKPRNKLQWL